MTDEHPPDGPGTAATGGATPDGHLDLEAASAAVDGEGTAEERAHLVGCPTCQAEVERLDRVRSSIGASTRPVPPAVREAAISAALDAFDGSAVSPEQPVAAPSDVRVLRTRQRSRPRFDAGPWLGVAAIVLLIALAVPLLSTLGGGSGEDDDAGVSMDDAAGGAAESGEADEGSAALAAPGGPVDVGDLGEVDAGTDLSAVVSRALPDRARDERPAAADAQSPAEETESSAGTDDATTTSPAPTTFGTGEDDDAVSVATDCVDPVRTVLVDAGALLLSGTATVDGAPAFVLGFDVASDDGTTVLTAVVAAAGCELITTQSVVPG